MKRFPIFTVCLLVFFIVAESSAEIYLGIRPLMTFGEVKQLFPGATYEMMFPAWAKKEDVMYSVTGAGISGQIIVKFSDGRPHSEMMMEKATDNATKDFYKRLTEQSDEEALVVSSVRWIPVTPFPLERLITKYGNPDKSDFSSKDFQPYKSWRRGIDAFLSDNGKNVEMMEFYFTEKEYEDSLVKNVEKRLHGKEGR